MKVTLFKLKIGEGSVWNTDKSVFVLLEDNKWKKVKPMAGRVRVPTFLNLNPFIDLRIPKTITNLILIENYEGKFGVFGKESKS